MWFANYELSVSPRKIHVNWLFTYKAFRHWSVRFLCWQNLSCFEVRQLYFCLFCSSWHNLVGIKITVRLHLLNRLFKCIQNSMHALLVLLEHSQRSCNVYCSSLFFFPKRHKNYFHVKFVVNCLRVILCFQGVRPDMTENGARFDRNPYVVASYFLKLSLEIRSVILKKKASNTYIYIQILSSHKKL